VGSQPEYVAEIVLRVCQCNVPTKVLIRTRSLDRALETALAHWSLYVGFWGEATIWLHIQVVDTRDGALLWQNGRRLTEKEVRDSGSKLI
jgi:hypothetical protein